MAERDVPFADRESPRALHAYGNATGSGLRSDAFRVLLHDIRHEPQVCTDETAAGRKRGVAEPRRREELLSSAPY